MACAMTASDTGQRAQPSLSHFTVVLSSLKLQTRQFTAIYCDSGMSYATGLLAVIMCFQLTEHNIIHTISTQFSYQFLLCSLVSLNHMVGGLKPENELGYWFTKYNS